MLIQEDKRGQMGLSQKSQTQIEKKNVSLERLEGKTGEGPFF